MTCVCGALSVARTTRLAPLAPVHRAFAATLELVQSALPVRRTYGELDGAHDRVTRLEGGTNLDRHAAAGSQGQGLEPGAGGIQLTPEGRGPLPRGGAGLSARPRRRAPGPAG